MKSSSLILHTPIVASPPPHPSPGESPFSALPFNRFSTVPFASLESNRKTMKSASGKRPPDEAHGVPRKRSYQAAAAMPGGVAKRGCTRARCSTSTAPHSTIRLNFVKHFFAFLQFYNFYSQTIKSAGADTRQVSVPGSRLYQSW